MNKIEKARVKINEIDREIASLFEERMKAVEDVISYKIENNLPILDEKENKRLLKKILLLYKMKNTKSTMLNLFG